MSEVFKKVDCILLPHSTSAIPNNLTVKSKYKRIEEDAAVIHHDTVCLVATKSSSNKKNKCIQCFKYSSEKNIHVTQVAWCHLGYETIIIITSTVGLQVFNQHGDECLFSHSCSDTCEESTLQFARGISQFNTSYFCIGNSVGCIRMFGRPDMEDEISFIDRKHEHKFPISDLSTCKDDLASVDEEGYIVLWRLEAEELIYKITKATISNCTGIKLKKEWLITIYGSGYVRLYTVQKDPTISLILSIEIMAHVRAITGYDISENNEYLLTVSEDSFAKIWHLSKEGNKQIVKHLQNIPVRDNMLIGGRFLTSNGSSFCVTAYDTNVITCFSLQK